MTSIVKIMLQTNQSISINHSMTILTSLNGIKLLKLKKYIFAVFGIVDGCISQCTALITIPPNTNIG